VSLTGQPGSAPAAAREASWRDWRRLPVMS
jgi:hypothetical protein